MKIEPYTHSADTLLIFGRHPATNHPRMPGELRDRARRGATIVSIIPQRERGLDRFTRPRHPIDMLTGSSTAISAMLVQPRLSGDFAVATPDTPLTALTSQAINDLPSEEDGLARKLFVRRLIAFVYALTHQLRDTDPMPDLARSNTPIPYAHGEIAEPFGTDPNCLAPRAITVEGRYTSV